LDSAALTSCLSPDYFLSIQYLDICHHLTNCCY